MSFTTTALCLSLCCSPPQPCVVHHHSLSLRTAVAGSKGLRWVRLCGLRGIGRKQEKRDVRGEVKFPMSRGFRQGFP